VSDIIERLSAMDAQHLWPNDDPYVVVDAKNEIARLRGLDELLGAARERISTLEALIDQLAEALLAFSPYDAPTIGVTLSLESIQRHALRAYEADKEAHR